MSVPTLFFPARPRVVENVSFPYEYFSLNIFFELPRGLCIINRPRFVSDHKYSITEMYVTLISNPYPLKKNVCGTQKENKTFPGINTIVCWK